MEEHIHLYNTISEFESVYNSSAYTEPFVGYVLETQSVKYNKDYDYYKSIPLTFNIISAGTINWTASNSALTKTIEYKLNDGVWTSITSNTGSSAPSISVSTGDKIMFKGNNATYSSNSSQFNAFSGSTAVFEAEGNIMSLIDSVGFATATTLASSYTFCYLFYNCNSLTSAENFVLPATTLANSCYNGMFNGCSSLTIAPALPATTLANECYQNMFYNCTSLTTAPSILPATTLANSCYLQMFQSCYALTTAPELPATALANYCYSQMFRNCTGLTTSPELPATTLADYCYYQMFMNCTSLATAPVLPATTLANYCYQSMFGNCSSLTVVPSVLPATTLRNNCYNSMFYNCSSLTTAPELPATILASYCYNQMFYGCSILTTSPELPATTLANYCYYYMFYGCTSLNYIKCLATNITASNCTTNWVYNVASTGTFVKNPNMSGWTTGSDGIPTNWDIQPIQTIILIEAEEDFIYGETCVVTIDTNIEDDEYLIITFEGKDYTAPIKDLKAIIEIVPESVGTSMFDVAFAGNERYTPASDSVEIDIYKADTDIYSSACTSGHGSCVVDINLSAGELDKPSGEFIITIGQKTYSGTVENGHVSILIENETPGTPQVQFNYSGDENYNELSGNITIIIGN